MINPLMLHLVTAFVPIWIHAIFASPAHVQMPLLSLLRESCKLDLLPLVKNIRRRLSVSHGILSDALPSHVVAALLSNVGRDDHFLHDGHHDYGVEDRAHTAKEQPPFPRQADSEDSRLCPPAKNVSGTNSQLEAAGGGGCVIPGDKSGSRRDSDGFVRTSEEACLPYTSFTPPARGVAPLARSRSISNSQMATQHECVSIFFSDICGFSSWAHSVPPEAVMRTLDDLYTRLDQLILREMPSLYKVETT